MAALDTKTSEAQKQDRDAKKKRERLHELRSRGCAQLLASEEGRLFLGWILETTGAICSDPFRVDPTKTAYLCGRKSVGDDIISQVLQVKQDGLVDVLKENLNHVTRRRSPDGNGDGNEDGGTGQDTSEQRREYK